MSGYIDEFISDHEEYFKNNQEYLSTSNWDLIDYVTASVKNHEAINEVKHKDKIAAIKADNKSVKSILDRLSVFIKEVENDRDAAKTQKFIDWSVSIIKIFINRCNDYLKSNKTNSIDISYLKDFEIEFQNELFNLKVEISDKLSKLNIDADADKNEIKFFGNQKASLPMMDVLPGRYPAIRKLTNKLKFNNEITDIEFYIHKVGRGDEIPEWNEKKNYWEQEPHVLDFWWNEWLKITRGFEVDGYFIHPWLYYHLNFYKTPIPQADKTEPIINPSLRDNEWYIAELIKKAEERKNRGLNIFGTRRFGKSVTMSSVCDWKAIVKANASTSIKSGSAGDLAELTSKIETSMQNMTPAFKLFSPKGSWEKEVQLGIKVDSNTLVEHSKHLIRNLDGGAKTSTQKTAGGAPSVSLYEEIGKAPWIKAYRAEIPAYQTEFGWKTIVIAVGTSGEAALAGDAMQAVSNPETLSFMEMDWDLLENTLPEGFTPTWKRRTFASFVPGQMGYYDGFKRIKRRFGDFLGIDSEYLNKIDIYQTDWENNTQVLLKIREDLKKDAFGLQQITVQYPIDPEECFLSPDKNPFPYIEAKNHKDSIVLSGDVGKKVYLSRHPSTGKIFYDLAEDKPLAQYPHTGGFIDSPVLLFEELPQETPPPYLYVAGFDDYKQEESQNSESVGTLYIFKRDILGVKNGNRIVASMSTRPDPHSKMHKQWHLLLEAFNAEAFGENEDMDFKKHLDVKRLTSKFLVKSIDFESEEQVKYGGSRKYGWQPTPKNKKFLLGLFVDYCNASFELEDSEGNKIEVLGVQLINDVNLLDEIINYSSEKNVDRITSMMGALGYDFNLYLNWIFPKIVNREKEKRENERKKKEVQNLAQRMYKTTGQNKLFR